MELINLLQEVRAVLNDVESKGDTSRRVIILKDHVESFLNQVEDGYEWMQKVIEVPPAEQIGIPRTKSETKKRQAQVKKGSVNGDILDD